MGLRLPSGDGKALSPASLASRVLRSWTYHCKVVEVDLILRMGGVHRLELDSYLTLAPTVNEQEKEEYTNQQLPVIQTYSLEMIAQ